MPALPETIEGEEGGDQELKSISEKFGIEFEERTQPEEVSEDSSTADQIRVKRDPNVPLTFEEMLDDAIVDKEELRRLKATSTSLDL